jgi:hypothetical protein
MISPTSSNHNSEPPAQPPQAKPNHHAQVPPTPKSGAVSSDQVTLKSAGQAGSDNQ